MAAPRDYYEVLGVPRSADDGELKRAYRKLAMELHPDRNPGNQDAEERFKEASVAYQVLSDPEKRPVYDRFGHEGLRGGGGGPGFGDVGDIFSAFGDIFGDLFGGGGGRGPSRGADVETSLTLTFAEAAAGVVRDIPIKRRVACRTCSGSGAAPGSSVERCDRCGGRGQVVHAQGFLMISTACPACRGEGQIIRKPCSACSGNGVAIDEDRLEVTVPAGVEDGSTLRLSGQGEAGPRGARSGDLYVVLRVEPDPRFERHGADLLAEITITFPQAVLGDTVKVPTMDGEADLEIPAGTQPGTMFTLRGRGLPRLRERGKKGDLVARIRLDVPKRLTPEQEAAVRALAAAGPPPDNSAPAHRGLFRRKKS